MVTPLVPAFISDLLGFLPVWTQAIVYYGVIALVLFISVILTMAMLTWAERRVLGAMHARIGPNRVGPAGLLQPFADVIKLMLKEIVIPSSSNRYLYLAAPLFAVIPSLGVWSVIPLWPDGVAADINAGLLYILALSSAGV